MPTETPGARTLTTAKIKITTKCNRSCGFCIFADGARGANMPLETFSAILDRLETVPFQLLHINGGEPTVHRDFPALSRIARARLPDRTTVLGTNAITLARNKRLLDVTLDYYDRVLIGCDDEHGNYAEVHAIVPVLRAAGKTVVVNSVLEGIAAHRLAELADLCASNGAVHVTNYVHHIDVGQPANELGGRCARYLDQHLMIELDGSCYRCFNAMAKDDSEFSVWDDDFTAKVFAPRRHHYRFCARCHEYADSGAPANEQPPTVWGPRSRSALTALRAC
ncbi:radical SAM protein [Streptomyces sp. B1866]|uniref:radical SAM protein n=1 Tax=Streptomyces sp. B1866 TaxID=3075431 RepID=UPI002891D3E7|nr:radical SAM protein [Streptomyces sp. B1866]MDT3395789.1 radical SAM protein [Streptomyces sp. B1866]